VSDLFGFKIPKRKESQPEILRHDNNLSVSNNVGLRIPNLNESQPVIVKQLINLIVSEVVFKYPCFKESQEVSFETTGEAVGGCVAVDSVFEHEYVIQQINNEKIITN
jgi:hypothetical protein